METNFNIKKTNPSSRKYFEKQKFSLKQFDKDLTMMTRKHENYINLLAELPAGEAIKKMIEERSLNFLVDIEGLGLSEKLEGGFLRINKEDGTVEVFNEEKSVKVLFKDSPLKVKDLAQPLVDEKDPEKNSNVVNSFYSYLEKKAYGFCLGRVVSRWKVETKMSYLRGILKVKWLDKTYLRWGLNKVLDEVGIELREYELKNGNKKMGLASSKKLILMSLGDPVVALMPWQKEFPEEEVMLIQGGDSGLVFSKKGNYTTAFVEVFPRKIKNGNGKTFSSFIRGEGSTVEEAEKEAFNLVKKAKECIDHDWDSRGRDNGHGFCRKCGVFHSEALIDLKEKK